MRTAQAYFIIFFALIVSFSAVHAEQRRPVGVPSDQNAIAFAQRAEGALLSNLHNDTQLVEAYFQQFERAKNHALVPTKDYYALGRFAWTTDPKLENLVGQTAKGSEEQLVLDGMVRTMVADWQLLTPDRFEFQFIGVTFLGALRCVVYDVKPLAPSDDGFRGRIYIEDKTWNIVRFTGLIPRVDAAFAGLRSEKSTFRVDSWRVNVGEDRWVPAYVYLEELPPFGATDSPIMKGQIRFWGYEEDIAPLPRGVSVDVQLTPSPLAQQDRTRSWPSPVQSNRDFESQAEENVLERLIKGKFLGASGDVEPMLNQIITNLVVTNHLTLATPIHCRVLLTTPLEVFTVGNTIVVSRGLIDVLPSESALALILAHQLAHNILGHPKVDTMLAFPDVLRISDAELLAKLRFQHPDDEETAADAMAMKLLRASPYKSTIGDGGLFLQAVQEGATRLTNLIQPHFGEHVADAKRLVANNPITRNTPVLNHGLIDQVAALPLGSKLILNPLDGRVDFFAAEPVAQPTLRECNGLGIAPFAPFLEYVTDKSTLAEALPVTTYHTSHGKRKGGPVTTPRTKPTVRPTTRGSDVKAVSAADANAKKEVGTARSGQELVAR